MEHDSDTDIDILNNLISNNTEEIEQPEQSEQSKSPKSRTLTELNFNFLDSIPSNITTENKSNNEVTIINKLHDDKLDSSDDEDNRYFEEQKYSSYGRDMKQLLKECSSKTEPVKSTRENNRRTFDFNNAIKNDNSSVTLTTKDVYSDPFFGIKVVTPLVSSAELKDRMMGKIAVTVSKVKNHVVSDNVHNDWVIAGVLISKSDKKTSQKGTSYCIWKISDLSDELKTVSIFLFSSAYKQLWKTVTGTVIGILNPNVLENKNNIDQATLSIDNPQKLMVLGKSKDMGRCKSVKKNGDRCTAIVNISRCEYCVYHVKHEYKKCSRRAELQSNNTAHGFTGDALKRMNMSQAMQRPYNGLASFVPVLAKRNEKLYEKDRARLQLLSETALSNNIKKTKNDLTSKKSTIIAEAKQKETTVELTNGQSKKDFEHLNKLRGWQPTRQIMVQSSANGPVLSSSPMQSKKCNSEIIKGNQINKITLASLFSSPRLGTGCNRGTIDFEPITKQQIRTAKMNAIKWVQEHGKIKAKNPNQVRTSTKEKLEKSTKRQRENDAQEERSAKRAKISGKFKEMLEAKSSHTDLIEKSYDEEKEKYFYKLEAKEKMEEKMMSTFKINCKAVKCTVCKYMAFSASDTCKEQGHPLRVIDAVKRFFKCADCGNRTVSLYRMPSRSCGKCSGSNWARTSMMDEKKIAIAATTLSIRGAEEKFLGSAVKDANLDLFVPDPD